MPQNKNNYTAHVECGIWKYWDSLNECPGNNYVRTGHRLKNLNFYVAHFEIRPRNGTFQNIRDQTVVRRNALKVTNYACGV